MAVKDRKPIILLSIFLIALSMSHITPSTVAAPFAITVSGNVFDDTGMPAPIGTQVNITIYDGPILNSVYAATVLDVYGFYYNDTVFADYGYNISVNATFDSFFDENNATVVFGKASYKIHIGTVIYSVGINQPADKNGNPGATLFYTFNITNTGNVKDRYTLEVSSSSGWSVAIPRGNTTDVIMPGGSEDVVVEVTIPPNAPAFTTDTLTFRVISVLEPTTEGTVNVVTTVNQVVDVEVIPPSASSGLPGETLLLTFQVKNTGNGNDSFFLSASSTNPTWTCSLIGDSNTPVINNDATLSVNVSTTVPPEACEGNFTFINLRASSNTNPSVYDEEGALASTLQVAGIDVTTQSQFISGRPNKTLEIPFSVRNTGNGVDSFTVTEKISQNWTYVIMPDAINNLGIGVSANVIATVSIPANATIGNSANFTLTATSVFNTSISDSKSIIITIIQNNPPVAVIASPSNNTSFYTTDQICFNGSSSYDPDNDTLTYNWTSDIDGIIGSDAVFNTTLSEGTHMIRLTVTDCCGTEDSAEIWVHVTTAPDAVDDGFLSEYWWVILMFIIVLIVILAVLGKKKNNEPDEKIDVEVQEAGGNG